MEKPTGEANCSQLLETALQIHRKLHNKSGTATLLDEDPSEEESEAKPGAAKTHKVIHLASEEDSDKEDEVKASKKGKAVKSTFIVKGYQTANPLEMKTRKARVSTSQAADTISAIGSYFSADRVREREDTRANTSLNFFQLQSALTELQEVRSRNEQLSDALNSEIRRADKLDNQNTNLKEKVNKLKDKVQELKDNIRFMKCACHQRHLDSDSESDNPRERCRRRVSPQHHVSESIPLSQNSSDIQSLTIEPL
jgi:hypothetical protein